ncbi:FixH family protein [Nitrosophilus alvini]|uniref:FixH family protein n=1 Tax=Nitrosophilus alvini TaxID=2714855 RepID=UPI00190A3DA0|nr:FixH family protein [Nitrosophilus alvini]
MRKTVIVLFAMLLAGTALFAAGFEKHGRAGKVDVTLVSDKPLTKGTNAVTVVLKEKNKPVNGAKVVIKVFMPEMPGMPYMEDKKKAKFLSEGKYSANINFAMRGTWQVRIYIITKDGKKYLYKGSVNI